MKHRFSAWAGPAALVVAGACSTESERPAAPIPDLVAVEELRIGSVDDPATSFTSFHALELAPDGRILTIHAQESLIRVHAPDGTPIRTIGSQGEGPGEFQTPVAMGFDRDTLWVWDIRTRRLSFFDEAGEHVGDRPYQPVTPDDRDAHLVLPEGVLPDGTFFGSRTVRAMDVASGAITESPFFRLRPDGTIIDTIGIRPVGGGTMMVDVDGRPFPVSQPFADSPLFAMSPARMEVLLLYRTIDANDPGFVVTKLNTSRDTLWVRRYPYAPIPLDAPVVDSAVASLVDRLTRMTEIGAREAESAVRDLLVVPPHRPGVRRLRVGRDGSIWVGMTASEPGTAIWRVLGPGGDVVGRVALPERFNVTSGATDVVWGMALDDLDVPYIVKLRLRPGALPNEDR